MKQLRKKMAGKLKYLFFVLIILSAFIRCSGDKSVDTEFEQGQDEQNPGGQVEKKY